MTNKALMTDTHLTDVKKARAVKRGSGNKAAANRHAAVCDTLCKDGATLAMLYATLKEASRLLKALAKG